MRTHRLAAAVAVSAALGAGSASAQFSGTFIFGDSLSDAGQYGARFTTNPGLTFPEYLAQRYGLAVTPSFFGGNDYAQGGAQVNSISPLVPAGAPNLSVAAQVSAFLAKGPLDPNALYQIQGGANDVFVLAAAAARGQITSAQLQGAVIQAASDLVAQVARLQAAGARYIVVYGLPDIGLAPSAAAQNAQANLTAISNLFNGTLNSGIGAARLNVIQVNSAGLLREIAANPGAFGFTNFTTPACTTASALQCTPATLRDPAANLTFTFADGLHPSTGLALIASQAAASMIEGPARMGAMAEAPLNVEQAAFRSIDARMIGAVGAPRASNKFDAWVDYDYSSRDVTGSFVSGDSRANTIAVGGDIKLTEQILLGIAFNYTEDKNDFGAGAGGFKLKETAATVYAGWGQGPWWLGATLGAGNLDYGDVHRNIQLGPLTRVETANASGSHIMGSVLGGYWFNAGTLLHGPYVRLAWQDVRVNEFSENSTDSTALSYGEQKRTSFITSLGWQATGQIAMLRPFARITWENESKNDARSVTATPIGLNGTYSIALGKPDDNYARYLVGAATDFGRVTGYLTASGTSGRSEGNGYTVTLGMRVPL